MILCAQLVFNCVTGEAAILADESGEANSQEDLIDQEQNTDISEDYTNNEESTDTLEECKEKSQENIEEENNLISMDESKDTETEEDIKEQSK